MGIYRCHSVWHSIPGEKIIYIFYTQNEIGIGMQRDDVFIAFATDCLQTP